MDEPPGQGEWTIRQIVHHIVDGDDIWQIGIKAALGNPEGLITFQWYWDVPQVTWAEWWNYAGRPVGPALALLRLNRQQVDGNGVAMSTGREDHPQARRQ